MVVEFSNKETGPIPVQQKIIAASLALLVYDYFLTLEPEIERLWKRELGHKLTLSTFLFFANRYLALLGYSPIILEFVYWIETEPARHVCIFTAYNAILTVVLQVIVLCMMLLRVYALYERRVRTLLFPAFIAICSVTSEIVGGALHQPDELDKITESFEFSADQAYYIAGGSGGIVVFDIVIFSMTLYKMLTLPKGRGTGLLPTIIRDGTLYLGVMTTLNVGNILVLVLADGKNHAAMINPMTIISSIMMTRLMLNIRNPKLFGRGEEFKTTTVNIRVFNGPAGVGTTIADSRNVRGNQTNV